MLKTLSTPLIEADFSMRSAPMEYQESSFAYLMTRINEQLQQFEHQPHSNTVRDGNWSKTRDSGRTLPVQFRHDIMRRTVDLCPADIILAPSGQPLTDLEYADDVVIFAESSTKYQHVVNLVSKLAAAYGLRLRPNKCKQMWIEISSRPQTGIRVDGQPIELVDEFCYLSCTLKKLRERCSAEMC